MRLPCALHERAPLDAFDLAPLLPGCVAYGGRLEESSERRLELSPLAFDVECAIVELAPRVANEDVFIVRTEECEAAAAGVVRAITLRFSTFLEGVATFPRMLAEPRALARVGVA